MEGMTDHQHRLFIKDSESKDQVSQAKATVFSFSDFFFGETLCFSLLVFSMVSYRILAKSDCHVQTAHDILRWIRLQGQLLMFFVAFQCEQIIYKITEKLPIELTSVQVVGAEGKLVLIKYP